MDGFIHITAIALIIGYAAFILQWDVLLVNSEMKLKQRQY